MNLSQQIACVKREIALRENVYFKQVQRGKMRQAEADYEIACMKDVLKTLERIKGNEEESKEVSR